VTTRLVLAADVDSPLLGPTGAAAVFGPQKGATTADVTVLEAALSHWADSVAAALGGSPPTMATPQDLPGAGAAGGVGFALVAVLGAERRSGVDVVLDLVGLDDALAGADLVVTGEGALDSQTLAGKAVTGVARRARAHGIPVVAVCGRCDLDDAGLAAVGVRTAYPLGEIEPQTARSIVNARELLRRTGTRIGLEWLSV
jgi:glycerate kinase